MNKNHPNRSHKCPICGKNEFNSWEELRKYMMINKDNISLQIKEELNKSSKIKKK